VKTLRYLFLLSVISVLWAMKPNKNGNYTHARAFFAVKIEKSGLRSGDSCKLSYSMFIPESHPIKLRFSAIPEQLRMINRQIRKAGVALSASTLLSNDPKPTKIDGNYYKEHRIWESYCMPLRAGVIKIPPMTFTMEVQDPRGRNYRVFRSEEVLVNVKSNPNLIQNGVISRTKSH